MENLNLIFICIYIPLSSILLIYLLIQILKLKSYDKKFEKHSDLRKLKSSITSVSNNVDIIHVRLAESERKLLELTKQYTDHKENTNNALITMEEFMCQIEETEDEENKTSKKKPKDTGITDGDIFTEMQKQFTKLDIQKMTKPNYKKARNSAYKRLYRKLKK